MNTPTVEKTHKPASGYFMLVVWFVLLLVTIFLFTRGEPGPVLLAILIGITLLFMLGGFVTVEPNESRVLVLFGTYAGTLKSSGFFFVNPFFTKRKISLRARNHNGESLKVNDKMGNPIEIAAVLVWQVTDTAKAAFEVDDYVKYVSIQSESAVRHLANTYCYDNIEDESAEITLRGGTDKVNEKLEHEMDQRLERAGIKVLEARISHLAYASEIAGAMLQRQQATAVVAARKQIVEGAVSMVEMALQKLSERNIVELDTERKAAMVSNLLVVLCGDRQVTPVVNIGTLHN